MGGLSIWHLIVVIFILGVPAAIGSIIWLVVRASKAPASAGAPAMPAALPPSARPSVEARLQELAALKSKGLITGDEYDRQRSAILSDI